MTLECKQKGNGLGMLRGSSLWSCIGCLQEDQVWGDWSVTGSPYILLYGCCAGKRSCSYCAMRSLKDCALTVHLTVQLLCIDCARTVQLCNDLGYIEREIGVAYVHVGKWIP